MTFTLTPEPPGSLIVLPVVGCTVTVGPETFSGTATLSSTPTGNPDIDAIEITGGTLTAPSFTLPGGAATGANTLVFDESGSSGTLDRLTGEFSVSASSEITNDLYPPESPIVTDGEYFGTVNMGTGIATVDSIVLDTLPSEPPVGCPVPVASGLGLIALGMLLLSAMAWALWRRQAA